MRITHNDRVAYRLAPAAPDRTHASAPARRGARALSRTRLRAGLDLRDHPARGPGRRHLLSAFPRQARSLRSAGAARALRAAPELDRGARAARAERRAV